MGRSAWTAAKLLYMPVVMLSNLVFFGGLFMTGAAITFWTVESIEVINIFTYGGTEMISYPMDIYPAWLCNFFTFVIPAIFFNYYPALYILDKPDPLGMPAFAPFLAPFAGALHAGARQRRLELRPAPLPEHRKLSMPAIIRFTICTSISKWPATTAAAWGAAQPVQPPDPAVQAVDDISFDIQRGELVGYLGPNGAGKSTTLKMLTGLLVPTSGEAAGQRVRPLARPREAYVRKIGAVFGQRTTLWWDLPVIESLDLLQHMYDIAPGASAHNLDEFRKLLELDAFMNTPVRSLSLGQRMRADLCAALLHDPAAAVPG